ncbi:MAG: SusC/RagA family TonB-linked outer membrane protein, partial [Cyclobacterium sp.]|uniref:SusC/RagA family TonB-linked outer membrane protein n=1 Tax=Cyclobacterium sp. TaxID=1966343 RepID=UPI0039710B1D
MLVKLLKKGPMLARYFIYGLAIQLLLFQEVVAFGVNEKDKSDALQTKPAGDLVAAILVEGKVVDGEGNPIPGAPILVKGTTSGTTTDIDGNFSLEVDEEAIIVVSFLGFITQEIEVGNQTDFEITLVEDIAQMDEVVVVGFGTQKKSHLTAAVEQIGSDLIENRPINRLSEALQGAVAGLYVTPVNGGPAQESNFNIRGYTGFGQKGGPLVLIDGIERTMSDVNPNDVESVTVLKDAAASAIYGSRAPSGVILITTKSGTKGEKIQVNYSGNYSIGSPIGMPQWANSWEYAEKINEQYRNSLQAPIYTEEAIQRMRDHGAGLIPNNIVTENGTYGAHWDMNGNSDWFDIMYKSVVPSQQHNASVSGGSNNTGYYVGLGYNESMGLIKGSDDRLNRYNALLKVNSDVTDWLSLRMSMNYVRTDEQAPNYRGGGPNYGDIWQNASASLPNWNDLNPNGSPSFLSSGPSLRGEGGTQTNQRNETTLTGGFTLKPFEGLDIRGNYTWRNLTSHLERNTFVIFVEEADGSIRNSARSAQQSSVIRQMNFTNYHTADIVADYNKQIGKHSINALVGYQEEYNNFSRLSGTGRDLYTNSVPSYKLKYDHQMDEVVYQKRTISLDELLYLPTKVFDEIVEDIN